ncbi:MAG: NTP transferase domain-containing protein, partial [Deltaproteobacteria bacterium]|nr:NTP transferase domain-containing protein [Deltaproteobacteria bacterium]
GEPLVAHVLAALRDGLGDDALLMVAVADAAQEDAIRRALGDAILARIAFVRDVVADGGPIAGLLASLEHGGRAGATDVIVVAADAPRVEPRWLARLASERPDAVALLTWRGALEPMCARYSVRLVDVVRDRLGRGWRSLMGLAKVVDAQTLEIEAHAARSLDDIDTPEDASRLGVETALIGSAKPPPSRRRGSGDGTRE